MLEEAPDELHDVEGHNAEPVAVRFSVVEEHGAIFHFDDAIIGDGDPEDIGRQVFYGGLTSAHCLTVDVPIHRPRVLGDEIEQIGPAHFVRELGAIDRTQSLDGQIEVHA